MMHIHEAVTKAIKEFHFIRRKAWRYPAREFVIGGAVKIFPTNSPDRCVIFSVTQEDLRSNWSPTADDLTADDWEVVR